MESQASQCLGFPSLFAIFASFAFKKTEKNPLRSLRFLWRSLRFLCGLCVGIGSEQHGTTAPRTASRGTRLCVTFTASALGSGESA